MAATLSTPAWSAAVEQDSMGKGALANLSLAEASQRVANRQTTSAALVEALLQRIDTYNPKLNAFITVMRESALRQAATLDAEAASGRDRGPLHGVPIAIKDNIDTAGTRTTMASAVFDDRVPTEDAFVVQQLRRAGAVHARCAVALSQRAALDGSARGRSGRCARADLQNTQR